MTPAGVTEERLRLVLRDGADALREAQLAIADFLRRRGAGPNTAARAELLLEELALNTLRHGFASGDAPEVLVSAWHDGARCGLELEDRGGAFDPTAARLPAKPASLREARIGGLGLPLLHRIAAAMAYERTSDGRNRLWLALPAEDAVTG